MSKTGVRDNGDGTFSIDMAALQQWYDEQADGLFRWLAASAATGVLENSRDRAHELAELLQMAKRAANAAKHSEAANAMFERECVARAAACEAKMWLDLRAEKAHSAWKAAVDAEDWAALAARGSNGEQVRKALGGRYTRLQQVLFPDMMFVSAGFRRDQGRCSICDESSAECEHVPGLIYAGQLCAEYQYQKFEADHIAIVEHPWDKRCYMSDYQDEQGHRVDRLTGECLPPDDRTEATRGKFTLQARLFSTKMPIGSTL